MAVDIGGGVLGGLGGASTGAALGTIFPGIGTGIGAGVGGLAGILSGLFKGQQQAGVQQAQRFSPQQQQALSQLLSAGMGNLQNPTAGFQPIRQNALNDFFQSIVPGLQTQFAGSGSNAYSSPQLQTNLSSAGAGLAQRLAALESDFGQRSQSNALNQISLGLTPAFENFYQEYQPGLGQQLFSGALRAAPQLYQGYQMQQNQNALLDLLKNLMPSRTA